MEIKILGCGASLGVPVVGCACKVCISKDVRNKRSRQALYIESNEAKILIDFGPDIRNQMINNNIGDVDGVLITHSHSDHIDGFDDVRGIAISNKKTVDVYMDLPTFQVVQERFGHVLDMEFNFDGKITPVVKIHIIEPYKTCNIKDIEFMPFEQDHGDIISLGFKFDKFAYSTDFYALDSKAINLLVNIDLWIAECLGFGEGPTKKAHIRIPRILELVKKINPKKTVFIHMSHEIDYNDLSDKLPDNIILAFDGMSL